MQNISTLKESRVHCGHEDTFSSTRRPRTREEFGSTVGRIISNSNVDGGYRDDRGFAAFCCRGGKRKTRQTAFWATKRSADKKAQSRTVPSMAEEELGDGVNPMGDVPKSVSRANFSHIKAMEENHQKA